MISTTSAIQESSVVAIQSTVVPTQVFSTSTKAVLETTTEEILSTISTKQIVFTTEQVVTSTYITQVVTTSMNTVKATFTTARGNQAFHSTINEAPNVSQTQQTAGTLYFTPSEVVDNSAEELNGNNTNTALSMGTVIPGIAGVGAALVLYMRRKRSSSREFIDLVEKQDASGMNNPLFMEQGFTENPLFEERTKTMLPGASMERMDKGEWALL